MTRVRLITRSTRHHWRTNLAVVAGVAAAVSVLAGALLVGDSVRGSLRDMTMARLGRAGVVISSTDFFREALAADIQQASGVATVPMIAANGMVTHEASGRRAAGVLVYGVDDRFWAFHGKRTSGGGLLSPALFPELGATARDAILVRLQKPSAIPIESLFGRKDDVARTMRATADAVLSADDLGEFSLQPRQADIRAIFLPLRQVQRELAIAGRVNTILTVGSNREAIVTATRQTATLEDLGATVAVSDGLFQLIVEGRSGIMSEALAGAAVQAATSLGWDAIRVFTYLANTIRKGDRQIPYSLVTATDLNAVSLPGSSVRAIGQDSIVLNDWAVRELDAVTGDTIAIDYFLWDTTTGLTSHTADFTLARTVHIGGLAGDRRLAPAYPGITEANSLSDWDPPFPVDLSRVRPQDEAYWKQYRTTPKAFIDITRGRDLWRTRFGTSTSVRVAFSPRMDAPEAVNRFRAAMRPLLSPEAAGVSVRDVRRDALAASEGATDFGEYFTYFSFFLVASALLLALLFFRLGVEQRLRQIGILRAAGFTISYIRTLLVAEAAILAIAGSAIGVAGALAYGSVIMFGLRTWWIGAVGTSRLFLHVSWTSLLIGAAAGIITAVVCVVIS